MWWRRRASVDFSAEIEAHLQLEADRLQSEGMSPEEARAAARRAFGNVTAARERFHQSGRVLWLDHLFQDVRAASRSLARSAIGVAATFALTRVVRASGGGGSVFDTPSWQAFVVPILIVAAVGGLAVWVPSRRALRIDPAALLRTE